MTTLRFCLHVFLSVVVQSCSVWARFPNRLFRTFFLIIEVKLLQAEAIQVAQPMI